MAIKNAGIIKQIGVYDSDGNWNVGTIGADAENVFYNESPITNQFSDINSQISNINGQISNINSAISGINDNTRNNIIGTIQMFAGGQNATSDSIIQVAPAWYLCNGARLEKSNYPDLFAIIGTTYGGDSSTSYFQLPDMRNRVPIGTSSTYSRGTKNGNETISYTPGGTVGDHKLQVNQVPLVGHTHTYSSTVVTSSAAGKHTHSVTKTLTQAIRGSGSNKMLWYGGTDSPNLHAAISLSQVGNHNHTVSLPKINNAGSTVSTDTASSAHKHPFTGTSTTLNVMQPYIVVNYIIYTGVILSNS